MPQLTRITELNARIRRIDLFCKLIGPLVISLIDGASTTIAIWVTLSMTLLSVITEYLCIARVRSFNIVVRQPKC